MSPADLEILISQANAGAYSLSLRFRYPAARQDKRFDGAWALDEVELRKLELDPVAYGEQLAAQLLAEPDARSFLDQALAAAGSQATPLHVRLFIAGKAEALHSLRWETLRLPGSPAPLATGDWVYFSRYLDGINWRPVRVPQRAALRALIAIAGPDVSKTTWAEVRTDDELQAAQAGLGDIPAVALATRGQVTLANLMANLRDGCDILYLVAHGTMKDGEPWLLLEQANGDWARTSGQELATQLGGLAQPPILVVLVSCQSAGSGQGEDGRALAALGPRLAAAGVPAVVAMQGNVSMDTAAAFMPVFLRELRRDGQVDRAMAVARGAVRERSDWYMPVLFTRLEDGRLFELPQLRGDMLSLDAALALLASMPLVEIPAVGNLPPGSRLPLSANQRFVGREEYLRALAKVLRGSGTAVGGQLAATTGPDGIGKTQLAVEFARRYGRYFAGGVFWVSCADSSAVPAEVVACGLAMELPAFDALDFPSQVQRVRSAWQEATPRLLIFDNCEDEAVLARWRPATGGCRVLVTSRRARWSAGLGVRSKGLLELPREESMTLLRRFRNDLAVDDPVLYDLAVELGNLPLALHLTGNFLDTYRQDVAPAAYLAQLRAPGLLAHRSLVRYGRSPTKHETHVGRTFALSYDRLDAEEPVDGLALALLARLACFAPGEAVMRDLLLTTVETDGDEPDYRTNDALRRLDELGLVEWHEDDGLVIHRLVADFVLALEGIDEARSAVEQALDRGAEYIKGVGSSAQLLPLQRQLRHVTDLALRRGDLQAARLCNHLGNVSEETGDLFAAQHYLQQACTTFGRVLSVDHPDTINSLNRLGNLLEYMGLPIIDRKEAMDLFVEFVQSNRTKRILHLLGASKTGKTHLLEKVYPSLARQHGARPVYLKLSQRFNNISSILAMAVNQLDGNFPTYSAASETLFSHPETEAADYDKNLTTQFFADLKHLNFQPVVVLFDDYDRAAPVTQDWLVNTFLNLALGLKHVRVVIGGHSVPEHLSGSGSVHILTLSEVKAVEEYIEYCRSLSIDISDEFIPVLARFVKYSPGIFVDGIASFPRKRMFYG